MRRGHLSQCVSPASLEFGSELELGVTGEMMMTIFSLLMKWSGVHKFDQGKALGAVMVVNLLTIDDEKYHEVKMEIIFTTSGDIEKALISQIDEVDDGKEKNKRAEGWN